MPPPTIAQQLAAKQREISVAEFFERNRQILGFDNPQRSLLDHGQGGGRQQPGRLRGGVHPAGGPGRDLEGGRGPAAGSRSRTTAPGSCAREIPNVFARLLYGSRFHSNRQARGQQGIGISAAVLYANLTTAQPAKIISKIEEEEAAHVLELFLDTQKNLPRIASEDVLLWDRPHGTRIELSSRPATCAAASPRTSTSAEPRSSTPTPGSSWSNRTGPG